MLLQLLPAGWQTRATIDFGQLPERRRIKTELKFTQRERASTRDSDYNGKHSPYGHMCVFEGERQI